MKFRSDPNWCFISERGHKMEGKGKRGWGPCLGLGVGGEGWAKFLGCN